MRIFKKKIKEPGISREDSLACIPHHMQTVRATESSGKLRLEYPLPLRPFFIQLTRKFSKQANQTLTKKIELDEYGTLVWNLIDGKNNIRKIIAAFANQSGVSLHDAEISVTTFMRELGRRGLIVISSAQKSSGRDS